jgi:mannose-6-phosphate isomerase-like protein (cupin superfamily)
VNLIALQPRERSRVHLHEDQEEVYLVLEGELTVQLEEEAYRLGPDDAMRVGPAVRRQLVNAGDEPVVLLALGGSGEHAGRDARAWADWDEEGSGRPP